MGAGASTEFNAEAVLADEGDPTEPMADEGYDSDLAGDIREVAYHRPRPKPVKPELDTTRGRLSAYPEVGGKAAVLPCAEHIHKPTAYPFDHPPTRSSAPRTPSSSSTSTATAPTTFAPTSPTTFEATSSFPPPPSASS